MSEPVAGAEAMEARAKELFRRIEQIDDILKGPSLTLVRELRAVREARERLAKGGKAPEDRQRANGLPVWIGASGFPSLADNTLAHSLSIVTAQRLYKQSRRFPWMKDARKGLKADLEYITQQYLKESKSFPDHAAYYHHCLKLLGSETFGMLNPFTGAQVFRVLMETGEDHAHTGIGCLAFFAMVWPLYRRSRTNPLELGARIERWAPNAYVTAKCLLPLVELQGICTRRQRLFRRIVAQVGALQTANSRASSSVRAEWEFYSALETLRRMLAEMAEISIDRGAFVDASDEIAKELAAERTGDTARTATYAKTLQVLRKALLGVRNESARLLRDANAVLEELKKDVIARLTLMPGGIDSFEHRNARFWMPKDERDGNYEGYVKELRTAALRAERLCRNILGELERASRLKLPERTGLSAEVVLRTAMGRMAKINGAVADLVQEPVDVLARWCATVANREIAHASARNVTDFNPAELASAVAVAVRTRRLSTPTQVSDAVHKVLVGAQPDGSWRMGHPYYSRDGINVVRAPAADLVWTLASTISHFPQITVADEKLFAFVDWLERTQREVRADPSREGRGSDGGGAAVGWTADRLRHEEGIHLPTTAYAINALLAVRDLAEHRLWELCADRFTVVPPGLSLDSMDPVDLAVPHPARLHSRLARMIRDTQGQSGRALYSLVLHGPPGSSKTAVATALARSMWKGSSRWGERGERLIRITPADFTRGGEDRVDSEAQFIFRLLGHIRGATILFDEIDDLLRRRMGGVHERTRFMDLVIPAMLNRLQDLRDVCERQEICFLFGTNYVERIEPALMRKGRIDAIVPVTYPDYLSRVAVAERILWGEKPTQAHVERVARLCPHVAARTAGWPWSAIADAVKRIGEGLKRDGLDDRAAKNLADAVLTDEDPAPTHGSEYPPRFEVDSAELRSELLYQLVAKQTNAGVARSALLKDLDALFAHEELARLKSSGVKIDYKKLKSRFEGEIDKLPQLTERDRASLRASLTRWVRRRPRALRRG